MRLNTDKECHNIMADLRALKDEFPERMPYRTDSENGYTVDGILGKDWVFNVTTKDGLLSLIEEHKEDLIKKDIDYAKGRWLSTRMSEVDEYMFNRNGNVKPNPDTRGKDWDFQVNGIKYDLKGTKVPYGTTQDEKDKFNEILHSTSCTKEQIAFLIEWMYMNQGGLTKNANGTYTGVGRSHFQNRIFLITNKETKFNFKGKNTLIERYCQEHTDKTASRYTINGINVYSSVIMLLDNHKEIYI